jgi:hypothetical protein
MRISRINTRCIAVGSTLFALLLSGCGGHPPKGTAHVVPLSRVGSSGGVAGMNSPDVSDNNAAGLATLTSLQHFISRPAAVARIDAGDSLALRPPGPLPRPVNPSATAADYHWGTAVRALQTR